MAQIKKPATPMARATKRGTPVAMPMKPGNIATGAKKTAKPMPVGKATKNTNSKFAAAAKKNIEYLEKVKAKAKPMTEAQKQAKALDALEAKRAKVAKQTDKRPNYGTN